MFQLSKKEFSNFKNGPAGLRSQFVTSIRGGRQYLPYAFTEQGVAMLSSVLNSRRAVLVNIAIMRVFVRLRQILVNNRELSERLSELEKKMEKHDSEIRSIFAAIRQLKVLLLRLKAYRLY